MFRAAFLTVGLYLVLCGAGLLFVDDLQLSQRVSGAENVVLQAVTQADQAGRRHLRPPEWLPFTFMGVGGVTMMYAVALPRG
ncbi:hypothetical protein [Planctomicrobium piriforme]|uniref:Uncharacterized protein n=1 Tax=Planctomicrobium piriforme TaxID=1576369 RepID=A0A1I3E5L7_9PLAN|nr:hypothetical protein [Planctomicrobium piriforme]SFH94153.1 hypothetical protein SAMN05421753_10486 [Planctomicrobium piriforme]